MRINDGKRLLRHFISKHLCVSFNVLSVDKGLFKSIGKDERWNVIWSYDHDILTYAELLTLCEGNPSITICGGGGWGGGGGVGGGPEIHLTVGH